MRTIKIGVLDIEYFPTVSAKVSGPFPVDWTWLVTLSGYGHINHLAVGQAKTERGAISRAKKFCESFATGILKDISNLEE